MRQVKQIMGMPISIDIVDCDDGAVFDKVFDRLKEIDTRFSTYKPSSEVSKYRDGKINESKLSEELKDVIRACKDWEKRTGGYFSAWYGGRFDPSGYVKGWAIATAGEVIEKEGYKTYCIGAGGDILARSNINRGWIIGVQDPKDKKSLTNQVNLKNGAVATSGNYERGEHIINPKTGKPANEISSLTVTGPDIIIADVLATSGLAMGKKGVEFVNAQKGYKTLAVSGEVVGDNS